MNQPPTPPASPTPATADLVWIGASGPLYEGELDLRFRVLREPLGMTREQVRSPFEEESLHLVAVTTLAAPAAPAGSAAPSGSGELATPRVVGCVLFHPRAPDGGRLFQMAVDPARQGAGLGARLVRHLEQELHARGVYEVFLHARGHVVGFYERLGYTVTGDPFVEVGIPHRLMTKPLP